jgi:RimJ/RimL family protein N-acetyltransferase
MTTRELRTERLLLRPWRDDASDIDFAFDLYSRLEVQRYIGPVPRVMQTRDEAVERVAGWHALDEHPVHAVRLVELVETGRPLGAVLVKEIPDSAFLERRHDTEIGWHFHPDVWGNGFATEAARAVLDDAFAAGIARIVAVTNPENVASQRVCRRIGLESQGLSDAYYDTTCALFVGERPAVSSG